MFTCTCTHSCKISDYQHPCSTWHSTQLAAQPSLGKNTGKPLSVHNILPSASCFFILFQTFSCLRTISCPDRVMCLLVRSNILYAGLANGSVADINLRVKCILFMDYISQNLYALCAHRSSLVVEICPVLSEQCG